MPVALFEHPAITVCRLAQNFPALLSPSPNNIRCYRCLAYQPVSQASTWPHPPGLRRHVCRIPRLDSSIGCGSRERGASPLRMAALRRDLVAQSRSRERPLTARSRHRANTDANRRSTQLDPLDFALGESRLRVTGTRKSTSPKINYNPLQL